MMNVDKLMITDHCLVIKKRVVVLKLQYMNGWVGVHVAVR